jgi:hypothetical protein
MKTRVLLVVIRLPLLAAITSRKTYLRGAREPGRTPLTYKLISTVATMVGLLATPAPQGLQALTIYSNNAVGNLSLVSPPSGPEVPSSPSGWNDVPGLSTAVYIRSGDNLEITVTAEIDAPGTVWLRALVDGTAALVGIEMQCAQP